MHEEGRTVAGELGYGSPATGPAAATEQSGTSVRTDTLIRTLDLRDRREPPRITYNRAAYHGGPAPSGRTLLDVFTATVARYPEAIAIDDGVQPLTYQQTWSRVQLLAERLSSAGIGGGDRVGIRLPSGTADLYLGILAVLAVGAAYVPTDADDPHERAETVWSEAAACAVLTDGRGGPQLALRPQVPPRGQRGEVTPADDAWVIFTSGSTGKPKGVAVTHRSAAAFVDAEARLFCQGEPLGVRDRVLAGLSVAFDASCEEMWLAWRHGACLVPAPRALMRTGPELVPWLVRKQITVVSTVPTMASLWQTDQLPRLRLLVLGGEACPSALADRLTRGCAEVWNTYGPTEATVVTSAALLVADRPVTIGLPLAGWRLAVVDPATGYPVPWGETGELVIGGAGLARYLDPVQDGAKFRPLPALGWDRAYRSGDLVRAEPEGLAYLGRADSQVKIRGFRIELSEIESVLMGLPGIAQAAVTTHATGPGLLELAAYYSRQDAGGTSGSCPGPDRRVIMDQLQRTLPPHLVPAYLEELAAIPLLPTGKADRASLPPPAGRRRSTDEAHVNAAGPIETVLAGALAEILDLERVSVTSHFFDDLAVTSLLVAHLCARVRERGGPEFPAVSTRDVYLHPTVRELAAALTDQATHGTVRPEPVVPGSGSLPGSGSSVAGSRVGTTGMALCGAAQAVIGLISIVFAAFVMQAGLNWLARADGWSQTYLRALAFGLGSLVATGAAPILAKWALIGRWRPQRIPVWSPAYLKFWLVKSLIRTSPVAMFVGSPLYSLYLRALGARIGRRVVILSPQVPVCTDLLTIGDDTVIRRDASFSGYRARAGMIETGRVSLGRNAFVGEHTVLDLNTRVGHHAQVGHASALLESQEVPDGACWHGSPAQRADVDYRRIDDLPTGPLRRILYCTYQIVTLVGIIAPATLTLLTWILTRPKVTALAAQGPGQLTGWPVATAILAVSFILYFGGVLTAVAIAFTVPRLLNWLITPGRRYPLYGLHHAVLRAVHGLTNNKFLMLLTGDSSYVVGYLRGLGYSMPGVQQTGSNFGSDLHHETPFLISIGSGTMVSDGVSFLNADFCATAWRTIPVSVGGQSFLGNAIAYPADGRTGHDCLIATKAMVPIDGSVREGVGLLGSPCFEIPRSSGDDQFEHLTTGQELRRRLSAKNRHNLATMALFLLVRWFHLVLIAFLAAAMATLFQWHDAVAATTGLSVTAVAMLVTSLAYFITMERSVLRFGSLRPRYCSIYQPYFWLHERYWKMEAPLINAFNGTPFKSVLLRLVGVKVGKRVFDDGCAFTERMLVSIGDGCTLNSGSTVQCHSMEDGIFKSDRTVIGAGVTLGVASLVHYGVTVGHDATVLADAFVMKGETVPAGARWGGNPARLL